MYDECTHIWKEDGEFDYICCRKCGTRKKSVGHLIILEDSELKGIAIDEQQELYCSM